LFANLQPWLSFSKQNKKKFQHHYLPFWRTWIRELTFQTTITITQSLINKKKVNAAKNHPTYWLWFSENWARNMKTSIKVLSVTFNQIVSHLFFMSIVSNYANLYYVWNDMQMILKYFSTCSCDDEWHVFWCTTIEI
jgi:hypothetical protein